MLKILNWKYLKRRKPLWRPKGRCLYSRLLQSRCYTSQASNHGRNWQSGSSSNLKITAEPSAPSTGKTMLSSKAIGKPSQGRVFWGLGTATSTKAVQMAIKAAAHTSRSTDCGIPSKLAFTRATKLATVKTNVHPTAPIKPFPLLSRDHLQEDGQHHTCLRLVELKNHSIV